MGCDIHCYIDVEERADFVSNLAKVHFGRNYWMFGLLAGVRVDPEKLGAKLLVEPRGLPKVNSYVVDSDNRLYVVDSEDEDGEGCTTRELAESWVKSGISEWVDENKHFVTHPDWHTHSYLYVDELKAIQEQYSALEEKKCKFLHNGEEVPSGYKIIEDYGKTRVAQAEVGTPRGPYPELAAIIAMMESINEGNPKRSRLTVRIRIGNFFRPSYD